MPGSGWATDRLPPELARTPEPPYYAVIFSSILRIDDPAYHWMSERMAELVDRQPGFLGWESARSPEGLGITVSYWASLEAVAHWKEQHEHRIAQRRGQEVWYARYTIRIAHVERAVVFSAGSESGSVDWPAIRQDPPGGR
jgi:heme-degrading monooxygenase HmoA